MDIDGRAIGMKGRKQQVADAGGRIPTRDYNIMLAEKRNYKFANYRHARAEQKAVLFPGCNFPSFFPETTKALVSAFGEHGIGTVFDCCGKPVQELGLEEDAQRILRRINEKMKENGVLNQNFKIFFKKDLTSREGYGIIGKHEKASLYFGGFSNVHIYAEERNCHRKSHISFH